MATIEVNPSIYFECPVCMEEIDDTWKMLPCQHVFCLSCLRSIYGEAGRNPQCPTCRQVVAVPIESLQKPRLLYDFHENLKISQARATTTATNVVDDELIAAIELHSIDDERKRLEEIDKENEHLQIALCKSVDEAMMRAEIESTLCAEEGDLISAIELSIRENNKRTSPIHSVVPSETNDDEPSSTIPFYLSLSDFNNHLKANGNLILDTMLTVIEDDEMFNSLESSEIVLYLKAIDRYLNTLKRFRKNQIDGIFQEFGKRKEREDNASSNNKDNDLTDLIKALEVEKNEDAIVKIVLKKSEILDPIDNLCSQFLEIQRKLDHAFVNLVTKSSGHDRRVEKLLETKYSSSPVLSHNISVKPSPSVFLPPLHVAPSPPLPPASSLILPLPTSLSHRPAPTVNNCTPPIAPRTFSTYSGIRKKQKVSYAHRVIDYIFPLPPLAFPSYSDSRGRQKVSSARGDHTGHSNSTYYARENYRGSRGNNRGYSENSSNLNVFANCDRYYRSRGNNTDYSENSSNLNVFANCDRYYKSRGNNRGYRGDSNRINGNRGGSVNRQSYGGRYFSRSR